MWFDMVLLLALFLLSVSIFVGLYRVVKGPSVADRVLALDSIGINMIAGVAVLSVYLKTYVFFEVILLLGILSFIGTIAFSKFIERGAVIERRRDR